MTIATTVTMAGYRAAPSSLALSAWRSSRSSASRSSTRPRLPLCSPAPITAMKMGENSRPCWPSAWAKLAPALTSARSAATRWRWRSSSASSESAVSARSSGRPELTRPASWRVQIDSPVELKTRRTKKPPVSRLPPLPVATGSTRMGTSAWARNRLRAARAVSASITPLRDWPWASRASNE